MLVGQCVWVGGGGGGCWLGTCHGCPSSTDWTGFLGGRIRKALTDGARAAVSSARPGGAV